MQVVKFMAKVVMYYILILALFLFLMKVYEEIKF